MYRSVFTGTELVEWLLVEGLSDSKDEAEDYGKSLLEGRVISHVLEEHYFHNENYFYKFII